MMKMHSSTNVAATLLVLGALAGCSLAPKGDPSQFFVLTSASTTQASVGDRDLDLAIGLGPVSVPEYLRKSQMVTRVGPNQISYAEYDRWAEPLDNSLLQVLGENLSSLLGGADVALFPWYSTTRLDFVVQVEVQRFERDVSGAAHLVCVWALKHGESGDRITGGQFERNEPADSETTGASVAAQSRLLGELANEIATAVPGTLR
jgi:uncharacterized lipoprotein YmbA